MSFSAPFIRRPIGTSLLTVALALAGGIAYFFLPVASLPQVEFPTISVSANLPGASPETMASSVATPLERQFGRIAGITEMTSQSSLGSTSITLQFDLTRNIDAAGRDVQAAINAARGQLPSNLPNNPRYRKVNPADAPIMLIGLISDTVEKSRMYDLASSVLQQKLAQVPGVGQVFVGGGALPAVRVDVNPTALARTGLGLEDVRTFLFSVNTNRPKGDIGRGDRLWSISATDQLFKAAQYEPLVVSYRNGAALRLSDIATVTDSVEDVRTTGLANGKPAILIIVFRQPGANIIETVDRIYALLPQLQAEVPPTIALTVMLDRTTTIRASVKDVQITLLISIALVVLVVFAFLRSVRSTVIPSVAVPVSLIGTFGAMYLLGYSIDNLSLMAMTIATGFVVDDAIVVIENITRHVEAGMKPFEAALEGAREIGFTVFSISMSLIAVFIPILLMGGIVGRLFREFAVTLSVAIFVSMLISLTTTPMMCAWLLKGKEEQRHGRLYGASERGFQWILDRYETTLRWVLRHQPLTLAVTLATMAATVFLYVKVPKGFFPQQDTGRLSGSILGDQNTSFSAMRDRVAAFVDVVMKDPDVLYVQAFAGGQGTLNQGRMFATLKPRRERKATADQIIGAPEGTARLRARRQPVPAGRTGPPHRRLRVERPVPVHAFRRQPEGPRGLGAEGAPEAPVRQGPRGPQQRPADEGPRSDRRHRPRDGLAPRHRAAADRRRPLRRLRPAAGVDDVHAAESVPRRDGGRTEVLAGSREPEVDLGESEGRDPGASFGLHAVRALHGAARDQPPGTVPGRDALVQPRARSRARRRGERRSTAPSARSASRPESARATWARRRRSRSRSATSRFSSSRRS